MSEMDDLKLEAEASRVRAQYEAINTYMDTLTTAINAAENKYRISKVIYTIMCLVWMGTIFLPNEVTYLGLLGFMFALMYDGYCFTKLMCAYREFRGAIEILRILGFIPPRPPEGEKKRKLWSEFTDMVKGWATNKKAAQDKVFAPA